MIKTKTRKRAKTRIPTMTMAMTMTKKNMCRTLWWQGRKEMRGTKIKKGKCGARGDGVLIFIDCFSYLCRRP